MVSPIISGIKPSLTLSITAKAKEMRKQGKDILSLAAGEPAFPLFPHIREAGIAAIRENFVKYTPTSGIPELKQAIVDKFKRENNLTYTVDEVMVTNGGKQALLNTFLTLSEPSEFIIPVPYWVSYLEQIRMAGGTAILADTDHFQVKADLLKEKITDRTAAILINSPCNPTGAIIPKAELRRIADLALAHDCWIISDEVYEHFAYDEQHHSIAEFSNELKTITINACSKTYAMTGLRIGYCAAPKELIDPMNRIQSHTTSNASSIAQKMALAALTGPQDLLPVIRKQFQQQRDYVIKRLNEMGLPCSPPEGAFYAFPKINGHSMAFCEQLLEKGVAAIPGIAFGADDHIRLSFVEPLPILEKAMDRLAAFTAEH